MSENQETLLNRAIAAIERPADYNEYDRRQLIMDLRAACDGAKHDAPIDRQSSTPKF